MLSCSWEGGLPRALVWWSSSTGDMQGTSEENANILVLRSSATYSGKAFVCHAKHPLVKDTKQCVLKLGKKGSIVIIWYFLKIVKECFYNCVMSYCFQRHRSL